MPKSTTRKKKKKASKRHDPLEKQIMSSLETGTFKAAKPEKEVPAAEEFPALGSTFVTEKMSQNILDTAQEQQREINKEQGGQAASAWGKPKPGRFETKQREDDDSDIEQEELLAANLEEDDVEDIDITEADESELSMFMPTSQPTRKTLADIIMEKIAEKQQAADGVAAAQEVLESGLDPKLVEVYTQVGAYLSHYTSGKVPKAFKIIPSLRNWEEVLLVTNPEKWTPQAYFVATRLFASNLNEKMAQRYYNMVLLPKIREDIEVKRRLNYHLYMSVKKAVFKPAAFFRGMLLPLAQENCTAREALIMSSILSKISIPMLHSSVALLKLSQMPYSGPVTLFMKTMLNKKYSLPYRVIDSLVKYFVSFEKDSRKMPVIWHQNVLMFVQRYKNDIKPKQKTALKALLRKQTHPSITSEIRRELFAQAPTIDDSRPAAMDMS